MKTTDLLSQQQHCLQRQMFQVSLLKHGLMLHSRHVIVCVCGVEERQGSLSPQHILFPLGWRCSGAACSNEESGGVALWNRVGAAGKQKTSNSIISGEGGGGCQAEAVKNLAVVQLDEEDAGLW